MHLLRLLIQALSVLLFTAFGTVVASAAPGDWSRVSYPVVEQELSTQPVNLMNTARAPPTASANVMATGTALAQTGNLRALDDRGEQWASLSFGTDLGAPNRVTNALPDDPSQLGHVFGNRPGHLPDTPQNRQLLVDTSNNPSNLHGTDRFGNEVHTITQTDGSQVWVYTRNGVIQNGGVNNPPKQWVEGVGLQ